MRLPPRSASPTRLPRQDIIPPLTVNGPFDERSGFRRVARAQVLITPLDLLAGPISHVTEMVCFGRPTRILEVRAGDRTVSFCVVHPFDPMAGRTRQRLGRHWEVLEFFLGQQFAVAEQHTLFADEQTGTAAPGRHPARWFAVALVPDKLERWLRADRRKSVSRDQRRGPGI